MVFTSLKVQAQDKTEFDRLLHEFALRTGNNLSQHELFHRILQHALASKDNLIAGAVRAPRESWERFQFDLPRRTDAAADLDQVVYGLER